MGQKDISEKILIDYNDVFADIINVCAFHVKEIINETELVNTSVHSQYKAEEGKLHEAERDVAKYWKQKKNHSHIVWNRKSKQRRSKNAIPYHWIRWCCLSLTATG